MATVRLYKCHNPQCSDPHGAPMFDFESAPTGTCPKCGISASDPQFGFLITPRVVIHYDPPGRVKGYGAGVAACTGAFISGARYTKHPRAVTCPACKTVEAHQRELEALDRPPAEYDVPVDLVNKDGKVTIAKSGCSGCSGPEKGAAVPASAPPRPETKTA